MRLLFILALLVSVSSAQQQDPGQLLSDAIQAQQRGDYQLAITEYRQLLAARPDNVQAKVNLGAALAHVGPFDEAIELYRSALPALNDKHVVLLTLGLAYYKKGDLPNAREQFAALHQAALFNDTAAILISDLPLKVGVAD